MEEPRHPIQSRRFFSLWTINAPLDAARLRAQMDQLKSSGLDGVVFHPRFYPNTPPYLSDPYMSLVSQAILHARSIGLAFWIYDEDGWPSGTVGGRLLERYPGDAQRWLGLVRARPGRCVAEFERAGEPWFLEETVGPGVDYLNPDLAKHFIQLSYDRYRTGLVPEAFDHVEAFFCDEPEFGLGHAYASLPKDGAIPWTPRLPELFRERYGEDLTPLLPCLFFPTPGAEEVRVRFRELLTDLFCDSFIAPLNEWCHRHGKLFTAHVKGEEHPLFQISTSGFCHQVFRHLSLPGIDALERYPANNFYPRQVSSASRQFGSERCMAEAFGGSGWGGTPEDLERYLLWLGRNGVTDFVMHLSQYRLDSAALSDWPPSQPLHLSWSHLYPDIIDAVRRELAAHPRPAAEAVVVAPYRAIMAAWEPREWPRTNVHNAAIYPDSNAGRINRQFMNLIEDLTHDGVPFDIADERTVERFAKASGGRLAIGNCRYRAVILDHHCQLTSDARSLVEPFLSPAEEFVHRPPHSQRVAKRHPSSFTFPVKWKLAEQPANALFLEVSPLGDGWYQTTFVLEEPPSPPELELLFADEVPEVALNGHPLQCEPAHDGTRILLAAKRWTRNNQLLFRPLTPADRPFVWLRGHFAVQSQTNFQDGPRGTVQTKGPFRVAPPRAALTGDLIADGFPFLKSPLHLDGVINLPCETHCLRLGNGIADAFRLHLNSRDCGWAWGQKPEFRFSKPFPAGRCRLRLEMIPNAYNFHGPHHYYQGDWFVVSPDQIKGRRNFADPPDAPDATHVSDWHFRPFKVPTEIMIEWP